MTRAAKVKAIATALAEGLLRETSSLPDAFNLMPIKIQRADGSVIDAVFSGYYDFSGKVWPSVGYPGPTGWTHNILIKGDTILTEVPPIEAYREQNAAAA